MFIFVYIYIYIDTIQTDIHYQILCSIFLCFPYLAKIGALAEEIYTAYLSHDVHSVVYGACVFTIVFALSPSSHG